MQSYKLYVKHIIFMIENQIVSNIEYWSIRNKYTKPIYEKEATN